MNFKELSFLCGFIAREYAEDFFRLLVTYKDISASEAASRLDIHIKTAQDFLEGLQRLGICSKKEVLEKKRPYCRYVLEKTKLNVDFDFDRLVKAVAKSDILNWSVRERKNSGAMFKTSRGGGRISAIHFFAGQGRERTERKLNLTKAQGEFMCHLPFPTEALMTVQGIIDKAKVDKSFVPEILDVVEMLAEKNIIERQYQVKKKYYPI